MKTQKGFAHLELILIAVAVIGIAGTGYYVYSKNQSNNKQQSHLVTDDSIAALPAELADIKTVDEIRTVAATGLNGATIVSVELENEDEGLVYKVKLSDGRVLVFNAKTGAALAGRTDDEVEETDEIPDNFKATISIDRARQIAQDKRPGKTIKKIELEMEEGRGVYSVHFTDSGRVDVDATNGAVVRVEAGDQEDDDDSSNSSEDSDSSGSGGSSDN